MSIKKTVLGTDLNLGKKNVVAVATKSYMKRTKKCHKNVFNHNFQ